MKNSFAAMPSSSLSVVGISLLNCLENGDGHSALAHKFEQCQCGHPCHSAGLYLVYLQGSKYFLLQVNS